MKSCFFVAQLISWDTAFPEVPAPLEPDWRGNEVRKSVEKAREKSSGRETKYYPPKV